MTRVQSERRGASDAAISGRCKSCPAPRVVGPHHRRSCTLLRGGAGAGRSRDQPSLGFGIDFADGASRAGRARSGGHQCIVSSCAADGNDTDCTGQLRTCSRRFAVMMWRSPVCFERSAAKEIAAKSANVGRAMSATARSFTCARHEVNSSPPPAWRKSWRTPSFGLGSGSIAHARSASRGEFLQPHNRWRRILGEFVAREPINGKIDFLVGPIVFAIVCIKLE
jgi:hypothetical protein